jgi:8-oxo-dGTP diphosphatase
MKKVAIAIISKKKEDGQEEFLLVSSKKDFGEFTGFYYPPGGHLEDGEDVGDALVREVKEELDLTVVPVREVAVTPGDVEGQVTYWWLCEAQSGEIKTQEAEIADAAYFTAKEMEGIKIWPATRNFFDKYIFNK